MPPTGSTATLSPHIREKRPAAVGGNPARCLSGIWEEGYHATTLDHIVEQLGATPSEFTNCSCLRGE